MELGNIKSATEKETKKRVGRGMGSGLGKTSGRGHKGQKARTGGGVRRGFEGGQTPLYRRLPKRGFSNAKFTTRYATINLDDLNKYFKDGDVVTPEVLKEKGILKNQLSGVKVLANGTLEKKLPVKANRFSSVAVSKIEAAGGKTEVI